MATSTYPIDPTGQSINNWVRGEPRVVNAAGIRVICLRFGAFFADSLLLEDVANNKVLTPDQFYATWRYKVPTSKYKKDVCGLIVITDPAVSNNVRVDYQVMGGPYSTPEDELVTMIRRRLPANRPAAWEKILTKPPALTTRDFTDDEFGFATFENALDDVGSVIAGGSIEAQENVMKYTRDRIDPLLSGNSQGVTNAINAHISAADEHPFYLKKTEVAALMPSLYATVRAPKNVSPANAAVNIIKQPGLAITPYRALYGVPQKAVRLQVSLQSDFGTLVVDDTFQTTSTNNQISKSLAGSTKYYWRAACQNIEGEWSPWSPVTSFTTLA